MVQASSGRDRIAVVGMGYVGCVTAACLAHLGHTVTGVDPDNHKTEAIATGRSPFYEPGLDAIIEDAVKAGLLTATPSLETALASSTVALICVGTPSEPDGNLSLKQLQRVGEEIRDLVKTRTEPLVVAIRSTVFPGTCSWMTGLIGRPDLVTVVSNPEFLREGSAVKDFKEPSLLVVGGDPAARARVAGLYRGLPVEPCLVSLETAELIKYACNAYHAVKIGFANEIGAIAANLGIDGNEVMATLCRDNVLNISAAYLKPGFAFGGSCLPKDLRALEYRARSLNLDLPLLSSAIPSNRSHLQRAVGSVLKIDSRKLGIFGLSFKENTDDLRESPVFELIRQVRREGRELRIWDPHIQLEQIYGANLRYLLEAIPDIASLLVADLSSLLQWSEHLVVTQKPSVEAASAISASGLPVLDLASRVPV